MRASRLSALILGSIAAAVLAGSFTGLGRAAAQPLSPRDLFLQRVDTYISLHRRLEAALPPQVTTGDLEALFAPRTTLAAAIRKARRGAAQGDIFTAGVALYFRRTVTAALERGGIDDLLAIVDEENETVVLPTVNGDYPAGASISFVPPCVLAALPPLPVELEYRFLGRALVLVDGHAGLIVDFVPQAFDTGSEPTPPAAPAPGRL
jgi:hypothetical protein